MPMMRAFPCRTLLATGALFALAGLPAAASAVEINDVFDFRGTVTDIGVQRGPGQIGGIEYRIEGKFEPKPDEPFDLDLTKSTVTFHNLFDEYLQGGNGEMVLTTDNARLVCPEDPLIPGCTPVLAPLVSSSSSESDEAKYETPSRFRPPMRVQIKNVNGVYQFNIRLDRGLSPQVPPGDPDHRQFPRLCALDPLSKSKRPVTSIRHSFTISDGKNAPVVVDFVKTWECDPPGRYHLRSR